MCKFMLLPSQPGSNYRLLRVLKVVDKHSYSGYHASDSIEAVLQLVNSRFLAIGADWQNFSFPSSVYLLWNLQTLIVKDMFYAVAPSEIWKMTQLRHIEFGLFDLPDPPLGGDDDFDLGNLQTLLKIRNFKCGEEVVKRIPNVKKLQICYLEEFEGCSRYSLNNLVRLHKLESFSCFFYSQKKPHRDDLLQNLILPNYIKKLALRGTYLKWEDMKTKIGLLPNLQVLKLSADACVGTEWETVEGQFCNLRFLQIYTCSDLEWWTTTDSSHFPRLEHLVLCNMDKLNEMPSCIGEIPTLQSIELKNCSDSTIISTRRILEEQEELDNVGLRVRVILFNQEHLESLASPNFQIEESRTRTQ